MPRYRGAAACFDTQAQFTVLHGALTESVLCQTHVTTRCGSGRWRTETRCESSWWVTRTGCIALREAVTDQLLCWDQRTGRFVWGRWRSESWWGSHSSRTFQSLRWAWTERYRKLSWGEWLGMGKVWSVADSECVAMSGDKTRDAAERGARGGSGKRGLALKMISNPIGTLPLPAFST